MPGASIIERSFSCLYFPFFRRFDRLAVENRRRRAGLPAYPLTPRHRLPDTITLELAEDVVGRRTRRKAVARQIAQGQPVRSKNRMAFIAARMRSCVVARPAMPRGSRAPATRTPDPSDRSDNRCRLADRSDGAPPSTSLFAITVSPGAVNHAIRATSFWVRLVWGFGCQEAIGQSRS